MELRTKELEKQWGSNNESELSDYSSGSHYKAWWRCEKGHIWKAEIKSRYYGTDCPYCSTRLAWPGETDLQTLAPEIASEWNVSKNGLLTPRDVTIKSNRIVWWICKKGHEWQATVSGRTQGKGCPYCHHKRASADNNFAVVYPEKLKLWDWQLNNPVSPYKILPHSNKIMWWVCKKGHHWNASVNYIVSRSTEGCPYCAGKRVIQGVTDLETTDSDIAQEWDFKKNILAPSEVSRCSHKKVYWLCSKGHSFKASIANRANGRDCPICANKKKGKMKHDETEDYRL